MRALYFLPFIFLVSAAYGQEAEQPTDFLSKEFHKERREKLREKIPANSVAVFFANAVRNRSNDVDYVYHQDPDFYYLTGYKEPHAVLLIFKDKQTAANGLLYNEIIFVQPRNMIREMWTGRRLGDVKTKEMLGLEQAFNNTEFKNYNVDFSKFSEILFFDFKNDVRNTEDQADLFDLIEQFKTKVNYPSEKNLAVDREPNKSNLNTQDLTHIMNDLRGIKTAEELNLLRKAVQISCRGQVEVMKAMRPGMSEREIQGIHEFVFKKYQAEDIGYPSIVGGGHNGCILHYIDNYKPAISTREMVLMDLGAEYHGYTADITRTIPANGKFSTEQKLIYDIVFKAQEEAMKICKPGTSFAQLTQVTKEVINKGLKELGILQRESEYHLYYPHGCCHHIGLDVHDRGNYDVLQENMVITIEPGIYIPENAKCDKRWWGIAVRIEDDFLITAGGNEHLSTTAPRTTEDIEATMALPSPLDDFTLPALEPEKN
ncbi:MAG TPA: aminopeptidase P N-terminal domain-containing protein [Ohtaekwangia sp.]|nr:aminopeptidase P N-terminal domain-containing protein [Ohtaekwangia sp.]